MSLKRAMQLLVVAALNILIIALAFYWGRLEPAAQLEQPPAAQALSQLGSRGQEVRNIQSRLKQWGYYSGGVDGIYGSKTVAAVKKFQKKHGLRVDGIAGPATLYAIGLPTGSSGGVGGYSQAEYELLGRIISAEARGESYTGQVAVGAVVLNRVKSPSFPDSIAGVIYQKGAFSAVTDGQFDQPVAQTSLKAARDAMAGWDPSGGALYYYNPAKTSNAWMHARPVITTIGNHRFCS